MTDTPILDSLEKIQKEQESAVSADTALQGPQEKSKKATLADALAEIRTSWSTRVKEVATGLKRPFVDQKTIDLQYDTYTLRQDAVDYYYYTMSILNKQYREYLKYYNEAFNRYKLNTTVRYSSDGNIQTLVEGELSTERYTVKMLEAQVAFMRETIKTIDSIIFGIKNKIEIEKIRKNEIEF